MHIAAANAACSHADQDFMGAWNRLRRVENFEPVVFGQDKRFHSSDSAIQVGECRKRPLHLHRPFSEEVATFRSAVPAGTCNRTLWLESRIPGARARPNY